jgi:hypothetical protein
MKPTKKDYKKMTVEKLLFYMVYYKLLTPDEAENALRTSELPDSIMERIRIMEWLMSTDKN